MGANILIGIGVAFALVALIGALISFIVDWLDYRKGDKNRDDER